MLPGRDGEQCSVITGGVGLTDGLVVDLEPGVGFEGPGAYSGAPGGPGAVRAAVQGGGDRALQAAVARAAQADRDHRLARGQRLPRGGGSGATAGELQYSA